MSHREILLYSHGGAILPSEISGIIIDFGDSYNNAVKDIIKWSKELDKDGEEFIKCALRILANFKMTRSGPFHENASETLRSCWEAIGSNLIEINHSVQNSGLNRDRYLLELSEPEREELITEIWLMNKKLLPFTMGKTTYGLVGASKILFSVLPEIVLPVDNSEWRQVFKTVDIGDVIRRMVLDIQKWEEITGTQFNGLDSSRRLTTLPSVYNVMAMYARPQDL